MSDDGAYDDLDMNGIDPVWYGVVVRRSWQDEIRRLDPLLRVLWDPLLHEIAVVYKNPSMLTDYAYGKLVGWALLIRFPPDMDISGIVENMTAMQDRNRYASPEAAVDASEREAVDLEKRRREALVQRDGEMFDEIETNALGSQSLWKDDAKNTELRKDRGTVHGRIRGRVLVPARLIGQPIKVPVGGDA